jgi:hypothetical protein
MSGQLPVRGNHRLKTRQAQARTLLPNQPNGHTRRTITITAKPKQRYHSGTFPFRASKQETDEYKQMLDAVSDARAARAPRGRRRVVPAGIRSGV